MGVPYFQVKQLCTEAKAVLFSSNFALYRDISARVMTTLKAEVGDCEVYSIDESFFVMPETMGQKELLALRQRIVGLTGIPVSIGVSSTKTIAKLASKQAKKGNGVSILEEPAWLELQKSIQCSEVWGIGRRLSQRLRSIGVETVDQFLMLPRPEARKLFGVAGERLQSELRGVPVYEVGVGMDEPHQSITSSRSFAKTVSKRLDLESAVSYHVAHVAKKLRDEGLLATRMSVHIRPSRHGDHAGTRGYREVEFAYPTASTRILTHAAMEAVREVFDSAVPYKKAGVVLTGLLPKKYVPTSLFESEFDDRELGLDAVADTLNERYGSDTVHLASTLVGGSLASAKLRSPAYTTRWNDIPTVGA